MKETVIELKGITKLFGDFLANDHVDFSLRKGEIHALLGENGAGKTTLMNILYGLYQKSAGEIYIHEKKVDIHKPSDAIGHGIGMVHQHFMLIPQLSVTENIFLGMKETGFILDKDSLEEQVRRLNEAYSFNVDPASRVWQLPVGLQQKVEILKVLIRRANILILDEPTAVLTPQEVEELFHSIRSMVEQGYSVILITHKLNEVMAYSDRVTVMRAGRVIGTIDTQGTSEKELATMMVGREVSLGRKLSPNKQGEVALRIEHMVVEGDKGLEAVRDLSLEVRQGEILGIAGVDGNGQLELGEAIAGLRELKSGTIQVGAYSPLSKVTPRDMLKRGLGHIPDDRQRKGLVMPFSIRENLIMGAQYEAPISSGIFLNREYIREHAEELTESFDIRCSDIEQKVGDLSGGNQQKVILAREFSRNAEVMLAIQPTRGLDIGAIEFVHNKLLEARKDNKAILLISTDLEEVRALSDRIMVMYNGCLSESVKGDTSKNEIGLMMAGVTRKDGSNQEVRV